MIKRWKEIYAGYREKVVSSAKEEALPEQREIDSEHVRSGQDAV